MCPISGTFSVDSCAVSTDFASLSAKFPAKCSQMSQAIKISYNPIDSGLSQIHIFTLSVPTSNELMQRLNKAPFPLISFG